MKYRADIDGLRSIAVLSVILYHFRFGLVSGGFIGVDVFFVLSGYLITGIIVSDLEQGTFSFLRFYERRIRRLIPALFLVVASCFVMGWLVFMPDEYWRFGRSAVAAQLYGSNVLFWAEADYFAGPSELKPLLHTWSLAIEEQFYVVVPPILVLLANRSRRWLLVLTILAGVCSFLLCQWMLRWDASGAFYLLPSRMWELALGSIVALIMPYALAWDRYREPMAWLGIAGVLLSIVLLNESSTFPGLNAAYACLGTALIIMSAVPIETSLSRMLATPILVHVGKLSYSLYLWHWPLLVFVEYRLMRELGRWESLVLLMATYLVAYASYRLVEHPIRVSKRLDAKRVFLGMFAATAVVLAAGVYVWKADGVASRFPDFDAVAATAGAQESDPLTGVCLLRSGQSGDAWRPKTCLLTEPSNGGVLIWGDSHASHLRHGIEAHSSAIRRAVYVYSTTGCPPVLGVDFSTRPNCKGNNDLVKKIVKEHAVDTILLAANWDYAIRSGGLELEDLKRTIEIFEKMHVEVWVIGQLPLYALKNPQYLLYRLQTDGHDRDDFFLTPRRGKITNAALKRAVSENRYVDLYEEFCDEKKCRIVENGQLVVTDSNHLSDMGSGVAVEAILRSGALSSGR